MKTYILYTFSCTEYAICGTVSTLIKCVSWSAAYCSYLIKKILIISHIQKWTVDVLRSVSFNRMFSNGTYSLEHIYLAKVTKLYYEQLGNL